MTIMQIRYQLFVFDEWQKWQQTNEEKDPSFPLDWVMMLIIP